MTSIRQGIALEWIKFVQSVCIISSLEFSGVLLEMVVHLIDRALALELFIFCSLVTAVLPDMTSVKSLLTV